MSVVDTIESSNGRSRRRAFVVVAATAATVAGVVFLRSAVDASELRTAWATLVAAPAGVLAGLVGFGLAFLLRAEAWHRVLPEVSRGQALAAIHVALGGNHVLPLRLGEPLRVLSVVRRSQVDVEPAVSSTVALRAADVVALLLMGLVAGPAVLLDLLGLAGATVVAAVATLGAVAAVWLARRRPAGSSDRAPSVGRRHRSDPADADHATRGGTGRRLVDAAASLFAQGRNSAIVPGLVLGAWLLEAVLVWQVARVFGFTLSPAEAVVVLAAAIAGQMVAVAPGGVGTYEAAAAAGLLAAGVPATTAVALALGLHAVKTLYSVLAGLFALVVPRPGMLGNLRLPRQRPARPAPVDVPADAPVVLFLPALDEGPRVAGVARRAPTEVDGHPVVVLVVDDGSTDDTAAAARAAGAGVVAHPHNRGLGAAVRTGLDQAVVHDAAAVAFCDADGEYDPAELAQLVRPVLAGEADYVAGSRFAGRIEHMRPLRRLGNRLLTAWVRWTVRQHVTDGQTGYRAFSQAAAREARIPHDYNYAQVLTIDLLARGFVYREVGITYRFRASGDSFVRLGRYLGRVVPTVWRQLNPPPSRHDPALA